MAPSLPRAYNAAVRIVPAPDVDPAAIVACLAEVVAQDPMAVPVEPAEVEASEAFAALGDDGVVCGVGWRRTVRDATVVEVRVPPRCRRHGVGGALYARLAEGRDELLASCDAGQSRVRRFLEHRGFGLTAMVFLQRWDGAPEDVPGAFRTARLTEAVDPEAALALLEAAHADGWPPPFATLSDLTDPATWVRVAWVDDQPVGVLCARHEDDVWAVRGFAVLPPWRNRGVGRALITELMRRAAADGLGVVLRTNFADETLMAWTAGLGFWTFRSWAFYRRAAERAACGEA